MAYRAAKTTEVSLFPFLSVLCAMIGVMMLLLVGVLSSRVLESEAASQWEADDEWPGGVESGPQEVRFVPDPTFPVTKQPKLVEVAAGRMLAHPEKRSYPLVDLAADGPELKGFFDRLNAAWQHEYLLMLVHSDGIEDYYALRTYFAKQNYRFEIGVEPFAENWALSPRDRDDGADSPAENEP